MTIPVNWNVKKFLLTSFSCAWEVISLLPFHFPIRKKFSLLGYDVASNVIKPM